MSDVVDQAISKIQKTYGKESIARIGDKPRVAMPAISTGILSLDIALGIGGLPKGRICEAFGSEAGGKSTLSLQVIAAAQRAGGTAAYIDMEHSLDPAYCAVLGVDVPNLVVSQPDFGEQALEITSELISTGAVSVVVVDSVTALVPKAELDGSMGESVAYETPVYIRKKGTTLIEIQQIGDLHKKNQNGWYRKTSSLEVLTHLGWKPLRGILRKKNSNNKEIVYTRTSTGYVGTTYDHSLFVNGKEATPRELAVFDRLDIYEQPITPGRCDFITADMAWLLGFYAAEGTTPKTKNTNRFEVCSTDLRIIEKCSRVVADRFSVNGNLRTVPAKGSRIALHVLSCEANRDLGYFMQSCVTEKSLTKTVPVFVLNGTDEIKRAFLQGFWEGDGSHSSPELSRKYYNNSFPLMAGVQFMLTSLGIRTNVSTNGGSKPRQMTLTENTGIIRRRANEILQFYNTPPPTHLYDISTEAGTFVVALGNIICHNSFMGLHARLMSQAMRKMTGIVSKTNTLLIFINQLREKIGQSYGDPSTTTGGRALKFYASVRLDVRRIGSIKDGEELTGARTKIKVAKNKVGIPFKEAEVDLIYGRGFCRETDILDLAVDRELVEKSGAWYSYNGERIGQGRERVKEYLESKPEIADELEAAIREKELSDG